MKQVLSILIPLYSPFFSNINGPSSTTGYVTGVLIKGTSDFEKMCVCENFIAPTQKVCFICSLFVDPSK